MKETENRLVSYQDMPFARTHRGSSEVFPISKEEFDRLKGTLEHIAYDNVYARSIYLQITGRCNFNCLHCFSAKDNAPLMSEMSLEQINRLLDEAKACGIKSATITGGEPLIHPHFYEIIKAFADRDMEIETIITNGYFLTQDVFDVLGPYGMNTNFRISFDGIGVHDEMRGIRGAEKATLKAIELVVKNGRELSINMQVNRKTVESIPESLRLLDKMGVNETNLIKTSDSPRWKLNSNGDNFTFGEFYEFCLNTVDVYSKEDHQMNIGIWLLNCFNPKSVTTKYSFPFAKTKMRPEEDKAVACADFNDKLFIGADGKVYPCLQLQGSLDQHCIFLGNVFEEGVHSILQKDSKLSQFKNHTREERFAHNEKCDDCYYSRICSSGSPCMSFLLHGDMLALDDTVCEFYESGMYERVLSLAGFGIKIVKEE